MAREGQLAAGCEDPHSRDLPLFPFQEDGFRKPQIDGDGLHRIGGQTGGIGDHPQVVAPLVASSKDPQDVAVPRHAAPFEVETIPATVTADGRHLWVGELVP